MPEKAPLQLDELVELCSRLLQLARVYQRHPPKEARRRALLQRAAGNAELVLGDLQAALQGTPETALKDRKLARSIQKLRGASSAPRPAPKPRSFQGTNANVSVRDLLQMLGTQRKTGQLRIKLADEITTLSFHAGRVIGAVNSRTPQGCRLSEILVGQGAVKRVVLERFLSGRNPNASGLGRALLFKGLVTPEQLRSAAARRIRLLVERVLATGEASFAFREGLLEEFDADVRLEVAPLLEPESLVRSAPNGAESGSEPHDEAQPEAEEIDGDVLDQLRRQLLSMQSGERPSKSQRRKAENNQVPGSD